MDYEMAGNSTQATRKGALARRMPFVFVGGSLALDLVNTEVVIRGKRLDLLNTPEALGCWWQAAHVEYPDPASVDAIARHGVAAPADLAATTELRSALRRLLESAADGGVIDGHDLDPVNRVLATGVQALEIVGPGSFRSTFRSRTSGSKAMLLPIASSALELLTGRDITRLHRCANERCILLFYDTTKSATRRWCSVECMNRARSAERHRNQKLADENA